MANFFDTLNSLGLFGGGQQQAAPNPYGLDPAILQQVQRQNQMDQSLRLLAMGQQMTPDQRNQMLANWTPGADQQRAMYNASQLQILKANQLKAADTLQRDKAAREQIAQALKAEPPGRKRDAAMFFLQAGDVGKAAEILFADPPETKYTVVDGKYYDPLHPELGARPVPGMEQGKAPDLPSGYRLSPDGASLEPIPGGPADPKRPLPPRSLRPTADQSNAALFYSRMIEADRIVQDPKIAAVATDAYERGKGGTPLIGNWLASPEYQQFDQAKRDFINAVLRKESGAAISPSEFDNAEKQYFPQWGDGPQVIAQKARNRKVAIDGMKRIAEPALGTYPEGEPAVPDGISVEEWNAMTPEERALWQ